MADVGLGTKSMGDAWKDFGKALNNTIRSMISALMSLYLRMLMFGDMKSSGSMGGLVGAIGGAVGSLVGLGGGGGNVSMYGFSTGIGNVYSPSFFHSGGIVGKDGIPAGPLPAALWKNAQRYHSGGYVLAPDDVPIIAQRGERVLSRREAASYGAPIEMTVNIHNNAQAQVTAEQSTGPGGKPQLDVFVNAIDGALAQRINRRSSQSGAAMSRTYGLNADPQNYSH